MRLSAAISLKGMFQRTRLVADREFAKVVADHLRLDLNAVEGPVNPEVSLEKSECPPGRILGSLSVVDL